MHVGLDLLFLVPRETGGRETYARELVAAMLEREPTLTVTAFVNRAAAPALTRELGSAVRIVAVPVSIRSRVQWTTGELLLVPRAAARARVNLLHSMANFAPASGPFRRVVTIHDLQYRALPQTLPWSRRVATAALIAVAARRADRIITVSAASRRELVAGLRIDGERVVVIPNGVRRPPVRPERAGASTGDRRVVLTVGTELPHKNLPVLMQALALMRPNERPLLMVAGHGTDGEGLRAFVRSLGLEDDVRLLGYQSSDELDALYAAADCLVLPSLYEGFGLPVIEAMARSVPVVCSDIPVLREVAGESAVYFDPTSSAAIADGIRRLLRDSVLADRLRASGEERAARFTWSAAADATLACYRDALATERRSPRRLMRASS
jgi:glycosyltransferase involved in cell wall biosynthesis